VRASPPARHWRGRSERIAWRGDLTRRSHLMSFARALLTSTKQQKNLAKAVAKMLKNYPPKKE
jgi:hypothetical protein